MPKYTLLVVDDEPDVVKSVQDLLRLDYRVLGATSAAAGLEILAKEEVQVVMTDQRMPEMTGVEFLHQIRGDYPEAVRLLFTGYADLRAVIEAINQGNVYRYVTKPWDPDELQTVIREAMERYQLLVDRNRLIGELKQKNQELESTNARMKQTAALRDAFIQVASHELRTPLTILRGMVRLALMPKALQSPERIEFSMERINAATERLAHLVDQLITMLTLQQNVKPIHRQCTAIAPLLNLAADDVRPFIELRKQTLETHFDPALGSLDIDVEQIRDALNHLLLNAVKFTPDGGHITLEAHREPTRLVITVQDTGIGMDDATIEKLFEPFFTGYDVSRHSSGLFEFNRQGLGLGLSVVKQFIEMHGGAIRVASVTGKGTTFTIELPLDSAASRPADDVSRGR